MPLSGAGPNYVAPGLTPVFSSPGVLNGFTFTPGSQMVSNLWAIFDPAGTGSGASAPNVVMELDPTILLIQGGSYSTTGFVSVTLTPVFKYTFPDGIPLSSQEAPFQNLLTVGIARASSGVAPTQTVVVS